MEQTKLIAGHQGMDNQIIWVTVIEVLEDIERIKPGEFLITTGFKLMEDKKRLDAFEQLLRQGTLSGVAIYTSFYLDEIPKKFMEIANKHHLPLIEIPVDINFSEITQDIMKYIINKQAHLLAHSEKIHHDLSNLILNNQKLPVVTKRLAELTASKIIIYDEFYHMMYINDEFYSPEHCDTENNTLYINDEKVDMTNHLISSLEKESKQHLRIEENLFTIYPIIAKQSCFGWIVMMKNEQNWQELDDIAIERASTVYAMEFLKKQAVEETKIRLQSNLLDDILHQNYTDKRFISDQALKLNYDLSLPQAVYHLTFNHVDVTLFDNLHHLTEQLLTQKNKQFMIQTKLNAVICLTNITGNTKLEQAKQASLLAEELVKQWQYFFPKVKLVVGIGKVYDQLSDLGKSAREAYYAATLHELMPGATSIIHYGDLGMYDLLLNMHQNGIDLTTIIEDNIHGLLNETNRDIDLIETIEAYFQHNLSIKQAAEKLFVHRHTLRYRLNQIEQKTGLDLKSTNDLLTLQLGVMAYKLVKLLDKNGAN